MTVTTIHPDIKLPGNGPINSNLIVELRKLLISAECGDIVGIGVVCVNDDRAHFTTWSLPGDMAAGQALVAGVAMLGWKLGWSAYNQDD